ncbi:hypothetical protein BGZ65_006144, partial [Modicella reniformis]
MNNESGKQSYQAFRNPATLKVTNIPTVMDSKAGKSIILWRDIQAGFKNADSIRNGEFLVPFMIDENLEQVFPLRIVHQPGIVLDVFVETTKQNIFIGEDVCLPQIPSEGNEESKDYDDQLNESVYSLDIAVASLDIADNTTNRPIVVYPRTNSEASHSSVLPRIPLHSTPLQTLMSGQAIIKQSIDQHFDRLQTEMDKNKDLQHQM